MLILINLLDFYGIGLCEITLWRFCDLKGDYLYLLVLPLSFLNCYAIKSMIDQQTDLAFIWISNVNNTYYEMMIKLW